MKTYLNHHFGYSAGFSAMELLSTLGLVGIIGSLSITVALRHHDSVETVRLESDVDSLNRVIAAYEAHGGFLLEDANVDQVLTKLKSVGDEFAQQSFPGYAGSFIDGRLVARNVKPNETGMHAVWDAKSKRFDLAHAGKGVRFELLDEPTNDAGLGETRTTKVPGFAQSSSWIWDYENVTPADSSRLAPAVRVDTVGLELEKSSTYISPVQLDPPIFSISPDDSSEDVYPLELTFGNPESNPPGTPIRYALDSSDWITYDGRPIIIQPGTHVVAYADAQGARQYLSSFAATEFYGKKDKNLLFAGQSSGAFRDAEGGRKMVVDYVDQGPDGAFEWGKGSSGYDTGSILSFKSDVFADVSAESWFRLGGLSYYNSTISLPTQATKVWMDLAIDFATPDLEETFSFELALENTQNRRSQTADQNADFVRISDPNSGFSTSLNGQEYELQLQFGYLGADGFATVDQFHVHEGAEAEADLWGFFSPVSEGPLG